MRGITTPRIVRVAALVAVALSACLSSGCIGIWIGTDEEHEALRMKGIGNAYVTANALDDFDGTILRAGIFGAARSGEILTLDIWPLGGIGIGLLGARVRVLPFEVAAGILFYHPEPPLPPKRAKEGENEPTSDEPTPPEPSGVVGG